MLANPRGEKTLKCPPVPRFCGPMVLGSVELKPPRPGDETGARAKVSPVPKPAPGRQHLLYITRFAVVTTGAVNCPAGFFFDIYCLSVYSLAGREREKTQT